MPSLDEIPREINKMTISASQTPPPQSDEEDVVDLQTNEPVTIRELTQTDRLNNRLLKSFLDRMNTGGVVDQFMMNANNEHVEEDRSAEFEE